MKTESHNAVADGTLAARVLQTFHRNVTHRSQCGADRVLQQSLNAWARVPSPEDKALFQSMGVLPETYDSLTRAKLVQIMAVLTRVFGQVGDKSWGLDPSPDPALPIDVQAEIVSKYATEGMKMALMSGAKDPKQIEEAASAALVANEKQIEADKQRFAKERAEKMERVLDDVMAEAGFTVRVVKAFIANLVKTGTAVMIGPKPEPHLVMTLRGAKDTLVYKPEIKQVLRFSVPSTHDVYPSPGAVEAEDADLCIRVRYTKATLARAAESKETGTGWRRQAIREILNLYGGIDIGSQTMTDGAEQAAQLGSLAGDTRKYEGVQWFGFASGKELIELGITKDEKGDLNPESYYDAEAVVMAGRVIFAKVCDLAVGRPVVKTTFYDDQAQFFGWPPALQVDNCQKLMNIAMSALKKQLQLSGLVPLVVNDYSSFVDADRPGAFSLSPGKVFLRSANAFTQPGQQGPAIQPLQLPNLIREIIALFDAIAKLADDASGFNRNMLGSGNFAGAARTASGLMQVQEAASIIATFVITNMDATAIVPTVSKVVSWLNAHHPDQRIKGDPQIVAKGQLSKVMKAAKQQMIAAGFQAITSPMVSQLLGPEKLLMALRDYLKVTEFPNADRLIPDAERMEFLESMAAAQQALQVMAASSGGGPGGMQQPQQPQQGAEDGAETPMKQAGLGMPSAVESRRSVA